MGLRRSAGPVVMALRSRSVMPRRVVLVVMPSRPRVTRPAVGVVRAAPTPVPGPAESAGWAAKRPRVVPPPVALVVPAGRPLTVRAGPAVPVAMRSVPAPAAPPAALGLVTAVPAGQGPRPAAAAARAGRQPHPGPVTPRPPATAAPVVRGGRRVVMVVLVAVRVVRTGMRRLVRVVWVVRVGWVVGVVVVMVVVRRLVVPGMR